MEAMEFNNVHPELKSTIDPEFTKATTISLQNIAEQYLQYKHSFHEGLWLNFQEMLYRELLLLNQRGVWLGQVARKVMWLFPWWWKCSVSSSLNSEPLLIFNLSIHTVDGLEAHSSKPTHLSTLI